jgi:hypothetical protein
LVWGLIYGGWRIRPIKSRLAFQQMGQEEEQKNNIDREELKELQTITHHSCIPFK